MKKLISIKGWRWTENVQNCSIIAVFILKVVHCVISVNQRNKTKINATAKLSPQMFIQTHHLLAKGKIISSVKMLRSNYRARNLRKYFHLFENTPLSLDAVRMWSSTQPSVTSLRRLTRCSFSLKKENAYDKQQCYHFTVNFGHSMWSNQPNQV